MNEGGRAMFLHLHGALAIVLVLLASPAAGATLDASDPSWAHPAVAEYAYDAPNALDGLDGRLVDLLRHDVTSRSDEAFGVADISGYDDAVNFARNKTQSSRYRSAPRTTRAVVGAADDVPLRSPNFVVHPNGEIVPVPTGAIGPTPTRTGSGFQFRGGSGGHGLDPRVTDVRIMDPVVGGKHPLPNGYVSYGNASGQTVNPWTGRTIDPGNPWWHWQWSP